MSKYETKDGTGSLFKNENKASDKHPDYSGTAMIDGVEMFMDAWLKTAESGRKWMSFSFKPKQKQSAPAARPAPQREPASRGATGWDDMPEDIPF
ncbi:hypothetical protein [Methylibium sp.]|uniref:hypothetical protein n=1 Tax=Methylibium sp. TaxID=2067992 RepID=UPI0017E9AFB2|nr:hypothetical protein [Methylibium sp.]MBA3590370.1 hypothetical protein [Methylibium sp.]